MRDFEPEAKWDYTVREWVSIWIWTVSVHLQLTYQGSRCLKYLTYCMHLVQCGKTRCICVVLSLEVFSAGDWIIKMFVILQLRSRGLYFSPQANTKILSQPTSVEAYVKPSIVLYFEFIYIYIYIYLRFVCLSVWHILCQVFSCVQPEAGRNSGNAIPSSVRPPSVRDHSLKSNESA